MLLVRDGAKANVRALLDCLALPCHARYYTTEGSAVAAGVHLSKVNGDTHNVQEELVPGAPVIDLVQGEYNCDSVCTHGTGAGAEGDTNGLGHATTAGS